MPNGRCPLHGGKSTGPPVKHGRYSKYRRLFGPQFARLASDPRLLDASAEIALFDIFLLQRAEVAGDGLSAAWLGQIRKALQALGESLFGPEPNPVVVRGCWQSLQSLVAAGKERVDAWAELLEAARVRAEIAHRAESILARREQTMTDAQMVAILVRFLEIVERDVGPDAAGRIRSRFEVEVLGRLEEGVRPGLPGGQHPPN
jgi:hypothetical protein